MTLNRDAFNALVRASGIQTEVDLADALGYDNAVTLWRIRSGRVAPSADFMARVLHTFPDAKLDVLFSLVVRDAAH